MFRFSFYRATRMHNADYAAARCRSVHLFVRLSHAGIESKRLYIHSQFLPRDAMHKRGYSRHAVSSVCPSVRLSVTFVDHVKTNKHIFKFFSLSGSHTILVFFTPNGVAIFRREPPPP